MSYKITKSETKKIGTIKLPKGIWLELINSQNINVIINPNIDFYIDRAHVIHNIRHTVLSNYETSRDTLQMLIILTNPINLKIDYNCTKSDCTNEWTFYEKVEDTVKIKPDTVESIWTDMAYRCATGENKFDVTI